jgi:hypothetical protein
MNWDIFIPNFLCASRTDGSSASLPRLDISHYAGSGCLVSQKSYYYHDARRAARRHGPPGHWPGRPGSVRRRVRPGAHRGTTRQLCESKILR